MTPQLLSKLAKGRMKSKRENLEQALHGLVGPHQRKVLAVQLRHRIAARRGSNRTAVAVGHSILVIAYHILKNRQPYHDLGANYFDERKSGAVLKNAVKRIEALGYTVIVKEKVA